MDEDTLLTVTGNIKWNNIGAEPPKEVKELLLPFMNVFYDEACAVGRRYRRQDEVGTPFCVTIDFETLGEEDPELKGTVTVRERDSMNQERVSIDDLTGYLLKKLI